MCRGGGRSVTPPQLPETDLHTSEEEAGREGDPGQPPRALASHGHGPHLLSAMRGAVARPFPKGQGALGLPEGQEEGAWALIALAAKGGRPPAHHYASEAFIPARARGHTGRRWLHLGLFSPPLPLFPGGGRRGVSAPSPASSVPLEKHPGAVICLSVPSLPSDPAAPLSGFH